MRTRQSLPSFPALDRAESDLLETLRLESYSESCRYEYNRILYHLRCYMVLNGVKYYTPEIGQAFLSDYSYSRKVQANSMRRNTAIIRRLDDTLLGRVSPRVVRHTEVHKVIPEQLRTILDTYLQYCRSIGNKQITIDRKQQYCELFLFHAASLGCRTICQLTSDMVMQACLLFTFKGGWQFVSLLLRYLFSTGAIQYDLALSVPRLQRAIPLPTVYSEEDVRRLEKSVERRDNVGVRDYAILLLASRYGIRCGDIALLQFENIDEERNIIRLIQQKTEQPLTLPLLPEIKAALLAYLRNVRPQSASNYVFLTMRTPYGPMTSAAISLIVKRAFEKSGVDIAGRKHGPHALRSSLATSMVNDDIPYEVVRKALGHANPNTIQHYAKVHIEKLREFALPIPNATGAFAQMLAKGVY